MSNQLINVLLVEDDEVDKMNVQRAFKKNNIKNPLYTASNGIEALEMLRTLDIIPAERRLILLDFNMPQMNGLEFLKELRQDSQLQSIPVIVLTTSNEERDRLNAYQFNVAGYILKPVTFGKFAEVIAALNKYWAFCEMP